jgi:hypothetical protein
MIKQPYLLRDIRCDCKTLTWDDYCFLWCAHSSCEWTSLIWIHKAPPTSVPVTFLHIWKLILFFFLLPIAELLFLRIVFSSHCEWLLFSHVTSFASFTSAPGQPGEKGQEADSSEITSFLKPWVFLLFQWLLFSNSCPSWKTHLCWFCWFWRAGLITK